MILTEVNVNFKGIEKSVQSLCFEIGCEILQSILESWDKELMERRDKSVYRHVGKKPTTVKTVIGEVSYKRTQYEYINDAGTKSYIFLLDTSMGIDTGGHFSDLLIEMIVQSCCASPYREAARSVSEMTGQTISHMAAWNVVQAVGEQLEEHEQRLAVLASEDKGCGIIESKVLFEEQDGISLSLQGKSREQHGERKDMKLSIAYDGARKTGKNRYTLTNKVACANFEGINDFVGRKEGVIADAYNIDEIEFRFLNGDGASWIRRNLLDESIHYQLDTFHRNRWVTEKVSDEAARKNIMKALYSNDPDLLLHVIEVEAASTDDETARENYQKLYAYFDKNKDGIVPYNRRGLAIPPPLDAKEYRRMGACESNIYTIIGNRMKGGRANWSIEGGNNLARLLCLKFTSKLTGILNNLSAMVLPERYSEEITVATSAAKTPLLEGKGYNGFHHAFIPSTQKWLKDIAALKPLSSL